MQTTSVKGPPGRFGLRNFGLFIRSPLVFLQELTEKYGDLVDVKLPMGRWLIVNHPANIEHTLVDHAADVGRDEYAGVLERALGKGLLTSDGDTWKRQRRLASAAFTPKRIKGYASAMSKVTSAGIERWTNGSLINLHEEMSRLTMEVVADVLFGANVGAKEVATMKTAMAVFNDYFAQSPEGILKLKPWVPTPRNIAMNRSIEAVDAIIFGIVEGRKNGGAAKDDLLAALLGATDEDGSRMSDKLLRDEVVTLFLAGHETTALALTHCLYLLAKHPHVERRVQEELRTVLDGRLPGEADVPRLVLVDRVIKESMRLYPPAWVTGREVTHPFEIDGYMVPPKTQVIMSQWLVHHDPRWYPNPEAFDPDRFEPEAVKQRPRFAYFPFGGGPRICIGNHFAMMEAVLMLSIILQRFRVELLPFEQLRLSPSVTLRPKGAGLRARVFERQTPSAFAMADMGMAPATRLST